jgi:hypothetical protein
VRALSAAGEEWEVAAVEETEVALLVETSAVEASVATVAPLQRLVLEVASQKKICCLRGPG